MSNAGPDSCRKQSCSELFDFLTDSFVIVFVRVGMYDLQDVVSRNGMPVSLEVRPHEDLLHEQVYHALNGVNL